MNWAEEADLIETIERKCRELIELFEPLADVELSARIMLVAARGHALEDMLKERLRREDETRS